MPPTSVNMSGPASGDRTSGAASDSAFTPQNPTVEPPVVDPQRRHLLRQKPVKEASSTFLLVAVIIVSEMNLKSYFKLSFLSLIYWSFI